MVTRTDRYRVEVDTRSAEGSLGRLAGSLGSLRGLIGTVGAGVSLGAVVAQVSRVNGEYETMTNRLRLVTASQEQLNGTMEALRGVSARTVSDLSQTVELYTNLRVATEALGRTNQEVMSVTENFQKAIAVSGADANTAAGAIRQFGQAMASGTVRGDEFNSIVEALGPALAIMARESGLTVGELREMSRAGELTADVFFDMIQNSESLNAVFASLNTTTAQTATLFGQTFDEITLKIDQAVGISQFFKEEMMGLNLQLADLFNTSQSLENNSLTELFNLVEEGALRADIALAELNNRANDILSYRNAYGVFDRDELAAIDELQARIEALTAARQEEFEAAQAQLEVDAELERARSAMLAPLTAMSGALDEITKNYERNIPQSERLGTEQERVAATLEQLLAIRDEELLQSPEYQAALAATQGRMEQLDAAMDRLSDSTTRTSTAVRSAADEMRRLNEASENFMRDLQRSTEDAAFEFSQLNMDPLQRQISDIERDIRTRLTAEIERLQAAMTPENAEEVKRQIREITAAAESAIASQTELAQRSYNHGQIREITAAAKSAIDTQAELSERSREHQRSFSDGWGEAFREYADNASNAASTAATIFNQTTRGIEDAIVRFARTGEFNLRDVLGNVGETLLRANVRNIISGLGSSGGPLSGLMNSLGLGGTLGGGSGTVARGNAPNSPLFVADVSGAGDLSQLSNVIAGQNAGFAGILNSALGQFGSVANSLRGGMGGFNPISTASSGSSNIIGNLLGSVLGGTSGGNIFGSIGNSIKNVFGGFFANGGYIPAGRFGIVGERGPEAVMGPASVRPGVSSGGMAVTINAVDAPSFQALVARDPAFIYSVAQLGSRSFV